MSDQSQHLPPPAAGATEERTLPIVAYALLLAGIVTGGLTAVIGVIIAHAGMAGAGLFVRSHYEFIIRTFWIALAAMIAGGVALAIGFVLSWILIGLPLFLVAQVFLALVSVWFFARAVVGLVYIVQDQPYPRPQTWLI